MAHHPEDWVEYLREQGGQEQYVGTLPVTGRECTESADNEAFTGEEINGFYNELYKSIREDDTNRRGANVANHRTGEDNMEMQLIELSNGREIINPESYFFVGQRVMLLPGDMANYLFEYHGVSSLVGHVVCDNSDVFPWHTLYRKTYNSNWNLTVKWETGGSDVVEARRIAPMDSPMAVVKQVKFRGGGKSFIVNGVGQEEVDYKVIKERNQIRGIEVNDMKPIESAWKSITAKVNGENPPHYKGEPDIVTDEDLPF